jgi:hypothetical protein
VEYAEALNDAVQEVKEYLEELKEAERLDLSDFHTNLRDKAKELLDLLA